MATIDARQAAAERSANALSTKPESGSLYMPEMPADSRRSFSSKVFWLTALAVVGIACYLVVSNRREMIANSDRVEARLRSVQAESDEVQAKLGSLANEFTKLKELNSQLSGTIADCNIAAAKLRASQAEAEGKAATCADQKAQIENEKGNIVKQEESCRAGHESLTKELVALKAELAKIKAVTEQPPSNQLADGGKPAVSGHR